MSVVNQLRSRTSLLTVEGAAAVLSIHKLTAYRWINDGKIPSIRVGTAVRIDPSALADHLEKNTIANKAA